MKKIALVLFMLAASGCANLVLRPQCDYNMGPYFCTKTVNRLIERGFDGKPIEQMFMPVLLIDWPFDAVADTVLLPWDAWRYDSRRVAAQTPEKFLSEK